MTNEADIRFLAQVLSIQGQIEALKIEVLRMELENRAAINNGHCLPWEGSFFSEAAEQIRVLSEQLETM